MFNCPEWGIGVDSIRLSGAQRLGGSRSEFGVMRDFPTSCEGLVHVCLDFIFDPIMILTLDITNSNWVHIGEIIANDIRACPTNLLVPEKGK